MTPRACRLRVLAGASRESLCLWEPYQARSMHEARVLAASGCTRAPSVPSTFLAGFLDSCVTKFEGELGALVFERGRVLVQADGPHRPLLRELRAQARASGVSSLDAQGAVRFRLRADDYTGSSALLRILAAGGASCATVRDAGSRLHLRYAGDALVVTLRREPSAMDGALRLLGFRRNARGVHQAPLDAAPYRAARELLPILSQISARGELEVTLDPPVIVTGATLVSIPTPYPAEDAL